MTKTLVPTATIEWLKELLGELDGLPQAIIVSIITDGQLVSLRDGDTVRWGNQIEDQYFSLDLDANITEGVKVKLHNDADISGSAYLTAAECAFHLGLVGIGRLLYERGKLLEAMLTGAVPTASVPKS